MNLYIQVQNEMPVNHPALESNLISAFGEIPSNWEAFVRVQKPILGVYEVFESEEPSYKKIEGIWTDVWAIRAMTELEKEEVQNQVKERWATQYQASNWVAWVYDENTNSYIPPIPEPELDQTKLDQGIFTLWSGETNSWRDTPPHPRDNKAYKFDYINWAWVEVIE